MPPFVGVGVGATVGLDVGAGSGVRVGVGTGVGATVGVDVGAGSGVRVGVGTGVGATVGVDVGAGSGVRVGVGTGVGVAVGVDVGAGSGVRVGVGTGVGVAVGVDVGAGSGVRVGVGTGVGVAEAAVPQATGRSRSSSNGVSRIAFGFSSQWRAMNTLPGLRMGGIICGAVSVCLAVQRRLLFGISTGIPHMTLAWASIGSLRACVKCHPEGREESGVAGLTPPQMPRPRHAFATPQRDPRDLPGL